MTENSRAIAGIQCKDILDRPILELISKHSKIQNGVDYGWCNWYFRNEKDVSNAMPSQTPDKVRHAKMRQLIKRGLVSGCPCGCRGDFVLTEKGWEALRAETE